MRVLIFIFTCLCFHSLLAVENRAPGAGNPYPIACRTDHLVNPLGIDNPAPRLSWQVADPRTKASQSAWQLLVGTDSLELTKGIANQWDSGRITSDVILVSYAGKELQPFTRYYWQVKVWDHKRKVHTSGIQWFETGIMNETDRKGRWIDDGREKDEPAAPYFRKEFSLTKNIQSARAYIAAAGLYELYINGEKTGNHRLDPMFTRYDRRNLYVSYDLTPQLKKGINVAGVVLGNGWYNHQSKAVWNFDQAPWRARPTFSMDIRIRYQDGSEEIIATGTDWKTAFGKYTLNSIYTGEHVDFNLERKGWNLPGFNDEEWEQASLREAPSPTLSAQQLQPIRNVKQYSPASFRKMNDTTYVVDFGQNMAGTTGLTIRGEKGTVVKLKHGERLYSDGRVDVSNIDVYYRGDKAVEPFQTDVLTLNGEHNEFMASFNYKGFRYVEITANRPVELTDKDIKAYFMHSDVARRGSITASYPLIEKLQEAANNSYLSNLMGYPTDCPQREKNGWTGDGHFAIEAALYNFDGITVYEKWLADHRDEQREDGVLPDIIPTGGWGYGTHNGLDWTSTIAIIPWNLYLFYGDSKALADNYENMKRYVDYVNNNYPDGLTTFGRGDWVPVRSESNKELTSSVYYFTDATIVAKAAELLGKPEDARHYSALASKIKDAVNTRFLNRETGMYASGTQTELSVPLYWQLVPEEMKARVAFNLNAAVEKTNYHLDVGVLGAKAILNALSENGYAETAYKLAIQNTYPSWGWWIENGATTLLENWDLNATRDISDNHMMFGEIGAWFYKGLGGIYPDPESPGFRNIQLRPYIPEGLDSFNSQHLSPCGLIESGWTRKGKNLIYRAVIPPNATASLEFPSWTGRAKKTLKAGTYTFRLKEKN